MTTPSAFGGPVSAVLESSLRSFVRKKGIVLWIDSGGHYTSFVDRLMALREAGQLPYEVRAFRGSYLALMLEMEGITGGLEKPPLLIHLPGFKKETILSTPLLELWEVGTPFRKALDTLVTEAAAGQVRPELIDAFKARQALTLEAADAWLAALLELREGGLSALLSSLSPAALFDDLLGGGELSQAYDGTGDAFWERLTVCTGLPRAWREAILPWQDLRPKDLAFVGASWALCVEYVHDLKRPPINALLQGIGKLPHPFIEVCRELASHLRQKHPDFYQHTADETEALLYDEVEAAKAEDLGKIDTFRFEEGRVLQAALTALLDGKWDIADERASLRLDAASGTATFWLRRDQTRQSAWLLVLDAARLGQSLVRAGPRLAAAGSLDGALERYTQYGAAVDQAHRYLEQRRQARLYPQLPEFEVLRACLDRMRSLWRDWADAWARDFNALCQAQGFRPEAALQQRTLFDEVVQPLVKESGTTAYFLIDAFRYEMGEELFRSLKATPTTTVELKPRLAELPTVTNVGMNVLAPVVSQGRLRLALSSSGGILGFSSGEFRVNDPETRKRAMHHRVGGRTCPWLTLAEVLARDSASLKATVGQARLMIVHSQEIDQAGENGLGPTVFDSVMQKLRAAWSLLREAGVRRFVFTSDHGFLLLDENVRPAQAHGRLIDPKHRYVISSVAADHTGEVRIPLADLGYEGAEGHLMFPESTAVFDKGKRTATFVHGGNSLQERVIPVLTLVHRAAAGSSMLQYGISAEAAGDVAGMHCLKIKVDIVAQRALDFGSPKAIELALRVPEPPGVQVELCQTRDRARIQGGAVLATVGEAFELFFRLFGPMETRVLVEVFHPSSRAEVLPCTPEAYFTVSLVPGLGQAVSTARESVVASTGWLEQLPEGGVRKIFSHLSEHGTVSEVEATTMLGGTRAQRHFANRLQEYARKAPFGVSVEMVGMMKHYVREGRGS